MPLPHITNSAAGVNRWEPIYKNLYEVYFTLPAALQEKFQKDTMLLTEHVQKVSGLGTLDAAPEFTQQSFMGSDRSYLQSKLGQTYHDVTVEFALNLREAKDNFIYKLFKEWNALGYDIRTGERALKKDYVAEWLKIVIANREGDVYREIIFHDVMMRMDNNGQQDLDYSTGEAGDNLTVVFRSDWATEKNI